MKVSQFIESLRRLYVDGKIAEEKIEQLYKDGKIAVEDKLYILSTQQGL